jgi:hypothetical protein
MPAIPKCGPGPGYASGSIRRSARYCDVTFGHPPINTITATTAAELSDLADLIEQDPDLQVALNVEAEPKTGSGLSRFRPAVWPGWAVWKVRRSVFVRPQKGYTKGLLGCKTVFFRVIWRTSGVLGTM